MTSMQSPATPPPRHEMMFLPVEDDALVFQICFYYGLLVVFLEVVVPLVFHRRLRLILPSFLPEAPVLSDDDFQQQKTTLEEQLRMQRLTSARKKKQQQQSLKKLALSSKKKHTPESEQIRSGLAATRIPSLVPSSGARRPSVRAQSTGKSAKSSASDPQEYRPRYSWLREDEEDVAAAVSPPSELQQPSSSFFASASGGKAKGDATTASDSASASMSRSSSGERRQTGRRLGTTGGSANTTAMSDTQRRQVQREERRYSWQKVADATSSVAPPSSKLSQPSFSSSANIHGGTEFAEYASAPSSEPSPDKVSARRQTAEASAGSTVSETHGYRSRQPEHQYYREEEALFTESPRQRSLPSFASSQHNLFDDSDEEFLSVIRRPTSPLLSEPSRRTYSSFVSEELDVERTISAAFGGRPLGGGASARTGMPVQYHPAPAPPVVPVPQHPTNAYAQLQENAAIPQQQQQQSQRKPFSRERRESTVKQILEREKTPRIIRRIAFDEEMMALSATPDVHAATPRGSSGKRKRSKIFSPDDESPDFSRRRTRL